MGKICIFSEDGETSTSKVMEWLWYHYQIECTRLNSNNFPEDFSIGMTNDGDLEIEIGFTDKTRNNLSDFDSFWYRRGDFALKAPYSKSDLRNKHFEHLINNEHNTVRCFIFQSNQHKTLLGSFSAELEKRKLTDLMAATKCGLKIPETIVANNRNALKSFLKKHAKSITKPIHNHINVDLGDHIYTGSGTRLITLTDIDYLAETFVPVILQEYLDKDIEIRTFFSKDAFYSMAIFSQKNEKTAIDYRNYDDEKPNRNVPFALPQDILLKIKRFNKYVGLDTGSIDIILTKNGDFYFLEVNPNGIFDSLSVNCNYFIEEKIAHQLAEKC